MSNTNSLNTNSLNTKRRNEHQLEGEKVEKKIKTDEPWNRLNCPVCMSEDIKPKDTFAFGVCGHSFCKECISHLRLCCPLCRKKTGSKIFHNSYVTQEYVRCVPHHRNLEFYCVPHRMFLCYICHVKEQLHHIYDCKIITLDTFFQDIAAKVEKYEKDKITDCKNCADNIDPETLMCKKCGIVALIAKFGEKNAELLKSATKNKKLDAEDKATLDLLTKKYVSAYLFSGNLMKEESSILKDIFHSKNSEECIGEYARKKLDNFYHIGDEFFDFLRFVEAKYEKQ